MQRPFVFSDLTQAVPNQIEAFADADSGGAGQQERIGRQIVSPVQFLLEELIVLRRKRSGQITRMRREVLAANQAVLEGVAVGREVVEQTAETKEAILAGLIAQRGIL